MRFYPFGSGSFLEFVESSSRADYAVRAEYGTRTISASFAVSGGIGPQGDPGTPSSTVGPYEAYPPICV